LQQVHHPSVQVGHRKPGIDPNGPVEIVHRCRPVSLEIVDTTPIVVRFCEGWIEFDRFVVVSDGAIQVSPRGAQVAAVVIGRRQPGIRPNSLVAVSNGSRKIAIELTSNCASDVGYCAV
jgi:hypothetical protein